ncbi:MAG: Gldg family protein [Rikenellaceae bacterium]
MKQIFRIAKTELQVLFYSPIAWFILIVFTFQSAMIYMGMMSSMADAMKYGRLDDITYNIFTNSMNGFFKQIVSYLFFYIPLLTMGLISRELSSGSIKLLYSSPISNTQIVLGKFLAVACYGFVMSCILGLYVIHASFFIENFDWPHLIVGIYGIFMLICAYGAVGVFMSSLTAYQMVAALGTLVTLTFFSYVGTFWQTVDFVREITYWLSMNGRVNTFIAGLICTEDVIYFLVVPSLFLTLTIFRLMSKRENKSRGQIFSSYAILFAAVVGFAFLSSRPTLKAYWDTIRFDRNTLTAGSQEVIKDLEGEIEVVTYSNIFDAQRIVWMATPTSELRDIKSMSTYTRFKPKMKLKYVYYATTKGSSYEEMRKRFQNLTEEEFLKEMCDRYQISPRKLLTEEQVLELAPELAEENFRTQKIVTMENGRKGHIRYFEDMKVIPDEAEITAGFKRALTDDFPKVAFVEGHDERSVYKGGDRNYNNFVSKQIRSSLYNQGFDVETITLDAPVPDHIHILVISDIKSEFTEQEMANYQAYVDRGDNLFILGEPHRHEYTNTLTEQFGVNLKPGVLVKPSEGNDPDLIFTRPIETTGKLSYFFNEVIRQRYYHFGAPSSAELEYVTTKGFFVTPIALTDNDGGTWNELQTRYFDETKPTLDPETEEARASIPVMVALERKHGDKQQKIIISGDADCVSSSELSGYHSGRATRNASLVYGVFNWMSDGASPIDVRRPAPIDNTISLSVDAVGIHKAILQWILPLIMLVTSIVISLRRRAK